MVLASLSPPSLELVHWVIPCSHVRVFARRLGHIKILLAFYTKTPQTSIKRLQNGAVSNFAISGAFPKMPQKENGVVSILLLVALFLKRRKRGSNPVEGNVEYYGLLTDIIKLDYYGKLKVVFFRGDWADVNTACGIKNDQFGFTMVNFSRLIHTGEQLIDEPYVFSFQVKQVFYSKDPTNEAESAGTRRGRGRTLLTDLYDLNAAEGVKVRRNSHGQPVGSEAQLLTGLFGHSRTKCQYVAHQLRIMESHT
ncbi:hypothetical protein J1N35_027091 [Gossypium stocksii]|uniref:DUF4216 domain-containing protein n=1 Tax=Gossypium stocksii TaxID=47602 RepID=A0A9D3ZZV4_9ROSI|nr:hypothetical protein J1N35_027091 [Gossypium stocksii]